MEQWREELYHHGILGQKWGVRRYQNPDGTLTAAGRKHQAKIYSKQLNSFNKNYETSISRKVTYMTRKNSAMTDKSYKKNEIYENNSDKLVKKYRSEINKILNKIQKEGYDWRTKSNTRFTYNKEISKALKKLANDETKHITLLPEDNHQIVKGNRFIVSPNEKNNWSNKKRLRTPIPVTVRYYQI